MTLDPRLIDEQLGIDSARIQEKYDQIENPGNEEGQERKRKLSRPVKVQSEDYEVFPGGPLQSEISSWKKQYGKVYMTEIEDDIYVWRPLSRFEYKEVMNVPNTNELSREEMICEICVLFPYEYTYEAMINQPGGVPSMIAEQIMQKSGFTRKVKVTLL